MKFFTSLFGLLRIKQWLKNILIAAAPIGAAIQPSLHDFSRLGEAFIAFSFVASSVYIFNDFIDRGADAKHPTKKNRPLASGKVSKGQAIFTAIILIFSGFYLSLNLSLTASSYLLIYFLLNISYSLKLKEVSVLEIGIVASGYTFRILFGAQVFNLVVSKWLMVFVFTFAFGVVAAKRKSEIDAIDRYDAVKRKVLGEYTSHALQSVITLSFSTAFASYSLWIFEKNVNYQLIPLVCEILALVLFTKLLIDADRGKLESPEKLISFSPISALILIFIFFNFVVVYL